MVQLEEVPDDELNAQQPGPGKDDEDDWDTDTGKHPCQNTYLFRSSESSLESEVSDVDDADALDETFLDRVAALKDIVPPTYRKRIYNVSSTGYSWASRALSLSGKTLWVVSTSALLLGVPWALAFSEEQQVQEMEKEMRMQQSANEVCVHSSCISNDHFVSKADSDSLASHSRNRLWRETCSLIAWFAGVYTHPSRQPRHGAPLYYIIYSPMDSEFPLVVWHHSQGRGSSRSDSNLLRCHALYLNVREFAR